MSRFIVPAGLVAVTASLGTGLVALLTRSPRTHTNLGAIADHTHGRHHLTPLATLGERPTRRPVPALLEREVSFSREVLPLLHAKAGPHAHAPRHSPPPHGVRLDSYVHIMEAPGVVVPGEPGESRIVTVLLDPGRQMPPSMPPLPEQEIQLIATWVAQGARDN